MYGPLNRDLFIRTAFQDALSDQPLDDGSGYLPLRRATDRGPGRDCFSIRVADGREAEKCAVYLHAVVGASWSVAVRTSQFGFLPTRAARNVWRMFANVKATHNRPHNLKHRMVNTAHFWCEHFALWISP